MTVAETDAPITISGLEGSGEGWMQRYLSRHPRIHIHGKPPGIRWEALWGFCETLSSRGLWAANANQQLPLSVPFYSGSGPRRTREILKRMLREWLSGFARETPRWGVVRPGLCGDPEAVEQVDTLWPETRWIVCLAEPLFTITLAKATLRPNLDMASAAAEWVETCKFLHGHGRKRVAPFQSDKFDAAPYVARRTAIDRVMACIGEKPTNQTEESLRRWDGLKGVGLLRQTLVLSDEEQESLAAEVPELARWMKRMGYPVPPRGGGAV